MIDARYRPDLESAAGDDGDDMGAGGGDGHGLRDDGQGHARHAGRALRTLLHQVRQLNVVRRCFDKTCGNRELTCTS